jgi:hypothetical protein
VLIERNKVRDRLAGAATSLGGLEGHARDALLVFDRFLLPVAAAAPQAGKLIAAIIVNPTFATQPFEKR